MLTAEQRKDVDNLKNCIYGDNRLFRHQYIDIINKLEEQLKAANELALMASRVCENPDKMARFITLAGAIEKFNKVSGNG